MPFCEIRSGESPVMSSPPNRICPEVGRNTPVRQLNNVDLAGAVRADDRANLAGGDG